MAVLWRDAWDVYQTIVWAGLVGAGIIWLVDSRHGKRGLRDRRGRLRPAPALALVCAGLFALGGAVYLFKT